jgi:hypothetical protein
VLFAEASFVRGRQVHVIDAGVGKVHPRDLCRHLRQLNPEQLDRPPRSFPDRVDHAGDHVTHDRHHVEVVADEAELRIE